MISVLLPVYNASATLDEAVQSILHQTFQDWELIIVDDGSTDGSTEQLKELAASDKRIRLFHFEKNKGIVAALNYALSQSRGDLIARMDADDISLPERLEAQKAMLDLNPQTGLVATCVSHLGDAKTQQGYATHIDWMNSLMHPVQIYRSRFIESPFAHPSVMFRKSVVDAHGGYEEGDFPEDYELWLRWMYKGVQMTRIPEVLLQWRDLPGRLSRTHAMYSSDAFYRVRTKYLALWLKEMNALPIWVWGAGRVTRRRVEMLQEHGIDIAAFIDIDPKKIGQVYEGKRVMDYRRVPVAGEVFVLSYVANRGAREEIGVFLGERDFEEGRDFVFVG